MCLSFCVSIIIPVHNSEEYLIDCLNSIIKQSYRNIEIICVNDHSTDRSCEILKQFEKKDTRIKIINLNKYEHGAGAARNRGLDSITGEYVAFCDSDDMMTESMVELMLKKIIKEQSDIVYCANKSLYEDNTFKIRQFKRFTSKKIISIKAKDLYGSMFDLPLEPWNKLINYKKFNSIRFNEKIFSGQDVPYNLELLLNADTVSFINEPLYVYRVRHNSLCHSEKNVMLSFFEKHTYLIDILKRYKLYEKYHKVYIRYFFNDVGFNTRKLSTNKLFFIKNIEKYIINNNLQVKKPTMINLTLSWLIYHLFPIGKSYYRFKLKERFKLLYNEKIFFNSLSYKNKFKTISNVDSKN